MRRSWVWVVAIVSIAVLTAACVPLPTDPPLLDRMSRVSVTSDGTEADGWSFTAVISGDGHFVAFHSAAANLVAGDANGTLDVFVHDRATHETTRVSVAEDGTESNSDSWGAAISADGRFVAFDSEASNLVPDDANDVADVFVHDRVTGATERVSVAEDGIGGNGASSDVEISGDGRFVTFASWASNLVPGDTNGLWDVFVHDRQTGHTTRASVADGGVQADSWSLDPAISSDGRYVSFQSPATNLVPGDTNGHQDVFVHDRLSGVTSRVSVSSAGAQGGAWSYRSELSADGRFVTFDSHASNLVPGDENGAVDVFVHDRETGATTRASVGSDGIEGDADSWDSSISGDGRFVAFFSEASTLVPGDANLAAEVFVHDRRSGVTERVSIAWDGGEANQWSWAPSIDAAGRFVTFFSEASNLVPGDGNEASDVFVHDRDAA